MHVTRAGEDQIFVVLSAHRQTNAAELTRKAYSAIGELLLKKKMEIVHERVFGSLSVRGEVLLERERTLADMGIATSPAPLFLQGEPPFGNGLAGIILSAVTSELTHVVRFEGTPCGKEWRIANTRYLLLQSLDGFRPDSPYDSVRDGAEQTEKLFAKADLILRAHGLSYSDTMRTWCYLDAILDWYGSFNRARDSKYAAFGIMPEKPGDVLRLPASTGIFAKAHGGPKVVVNLLAAQPIDGRGCRLERLCNTAQKDAFRYGASFSRGALISGDSPSVMQLSGTASIDETGKSIHLGDAKAQIETTLDKVDTLLRANGTSLSQMAAATVFVKRAAFATLFWEEISKRGLRDFPGVLVVADVCRDELLFEMDGEVIVAD